MLSAQRSDAPSSPNSSQNCLARGNCPPDRGQPKASLSLTVLLCCIVILERKEPDVGVNFAGAVDTMDYLALLVDICKGAAVTRSSRRPPSSMGTS